MWGGRLKQLVDKWPHDARFSGVDKLRRDAECERMEWSAPDDDDDDAATLCDPLPVSPPPLPPPGSCERLSLKTQDLLDAKLRQERHDKPSPISVERLCSPSSSPG